MKMIIRSLSLFAVGLVTWGAVAAQETNSATLKSILSGKQFVFKAQSAWPLQGTVVQLTSGYDMKVLQDSINTYLPYFGRAFNASYGTEGGINFTSKKFRINEKKRGFCFQNPPGMPSLAHVQAHKGIGPLNLLHY